VLSGLDSSEVFVLELTDSLTVWATWVKDFLDDEAWRAEVGIQQVMYGDQDKIPVVPMVCVEPSSKRRDFNGAPRRTQIDFEVYVLVYYGTLQDTQLNRAEVDRIAEAVEARLHEAQRCDGLVISSLVTGLDSGAANKGGALMRATRLTFTARSQIMLPYNIGG
jgi:hypothetical protein